MSLQKVYSKWISTSNAFRYLHNANVWNKHCADIEVDWIRARNKSAEHVVVSSTTNHNSIRIRVSSFYCGYGVRKHNMGVVGLKKIKQYQHLLKLASWHFD